ncbi:hypothetical protein ME121_3103 [Methylobacterium sp. ME121]|nr:hypothetical protein ME121_3103 [Methylobacterium sp. ME121]
MDSGVARQPIAVHDGPEGAPWRDRDPAVIEMSCGFVTDAHAFGATFAGLAPSERKPPIRRFIAGVRRSEV